MCHVKEWNCGTAAAKKRSQGQCQRHHHRQDRHHVAPKFREVSERTETEKDQNTSWGVRDQTIAVPEWREQTLNPLN